MYAEERIETKQVSEEVDDTVSVEEQYENSVKLVQKSLDVPDEYYKKASTLKTKKVTDLVPDSWL